MSPAVRPSPPPDPDPPPLACLEQLDRQIGDRVVNDPTGPPEARNGPGLRAQGHPDDQVPLTKATAPSSAKEAAAMPMVRHPGDDSLVAASAACQSCGRDLVTALRQVLAERWEAWQAGVLEGYGTGWTQGLAAGLERGAA